MLLQLALSFSLVPMCLAAALTASCGSIYKSFAQCLIMLGDSLVDTQKDQSSQDVDAICRSWNAFHVCASSALAGCPHAAAVWESLRQESRKTQFSGNLYELCDSRTTLAPSTVPVPERQPTPDQTNQETLKGCGFNPYPNSTLLFLPWTSLLMVVLKM